jgi:hypothetical protein
VLAYEETLQWQRGWDLNVIEDMIQEVDDSTWEWLREAEELEVG